MEEEILHPTAEATRFARIDLSLNWIGPPGESSGIGAAVVSKFSSLEQ
jgi:hypothetical protein